MDRDKALKIKAEAREEGFLDGRLVMSPRILVDWTPKETTQEEEVAALDSAKACLLKYVD